MLVFHPHIFFLCIYALYYLPLFTNQNEVLGFKFILLCPCTLVYIYFRGPGVCAFIYTSGKGARLQV